MTMEVIAAMVLVVTRIFCFVAYTMLAVHSIVTLMYKDQPRELREVTVFLLLLMSAISLASLMSIYNWLENIENWSTVSSPFTAMVVAIMFMFPGALGLKIFKPWKLPK